MKHSLSLFAIQLLASCAALHAADESKPATNRPSEWRANGADFELLTTVPANSTATVFLPAKDATSVTEGGKPLAGASGAKLLRSEPGCVVIAVESGTYHFQSKR